MKQTSLKPGRVAEKYDDMDDMVGPTEGKYSKSVNELFQSSSSTLNPASLKSKLVHFEVTIN